MKTVNRRFVISFPPVKIIGIIFFLYTLGNFCVPMLKWNEKFVQIPLYLFFLVSLLYIKRDNHIIKRYLIWYTPFLMMCMLSSLYAPVMKDATGLFMSLIMAFLFGLSMAVFLSFDGSLLYIQYSYILIAIFVGIRLIMTFQQRSWWSRLGENFEMNENLVALYFLIALCFAINQLGNKKSIIINSASAIVSAYVILLTGSKKALFAAVIFSFLFFVIRAGRITKKMRVILITAISVIVMYNIIMSVELLYNILGYRIQAMVNTFILRDFASSSNSTGERGDMILFGLRTFIRSPLWGRGLNSFQNLYGIETGHYAYAHNNYVELLADLGLIGFLLYYSIFGKMIQYIRRLGSKVNSCSFLISLTALLFFYDVAMVSYYDTRIIMLIMITFSGLSNSLIQCNKEESISNE